jgi:hypothetical protein
MVTPEQGLIDLGQTYQVYRETGWLFIRKLAAYMDKDTGFGPDYRYQVADHLGINPKTLQNYVSVARNPISHYAEKLNLTIGHAGAAASPELPEEERRAILLLAAEEGLSEDWIRYEIRNRKLSWNQEKEQRLMNTAQLDRTETPVSAQNAPQDKTYHTEIKPVTAPVLSSHSEDGRQYQYSEFDDNEDYVPFVHYDIDLEDDDTPFDVAERIVEARGVPFAQKVAEEITRWGSWT